MRSVSDSVDKIITVMVIRPLDDRTYCARSAFTHLRHCDLSWHHFRIRQEKPTNCVGKFLAGKHYGESTEYFGACATTMTSQRIAIRIVVQSATIWLYFEGGFGGPPIWGFGESEVVKSCANRKHTNDFPMPLHTTFCSICRRLAAIPMASYDPPTRPH